MQTQKGNYKKLIKETIVKDVNSCRVITITLDEDVEYKNLYPPYEIGTTNSFRIQVDERTTEIKKIELVCEGIFGSFFFANIDSVNLLSISLGRLKPMIEKKIKIMILEDTLGGK